MEEVSECTRSSSSSSSSYSKMGVPPFLLHDDRQEGIHLFLANISSIIPFVYYRRRRCHSAAAHAGGGGTATMRCATVAATAAVAVRAPRLSGCNAATWATTAKNVKKPPGKKGGMFRKSKMLFEILVTFSIF